MRMFWCLVVAIVGLFFTSSPLTAAELADLVGPDSRVEKLAGGFAFTEGPAWSPQGFLLFSDIPNEAIVRLGEDGATSDFLKPSGKANGLMFDARGYLYACQGGARKVVRIDVAAPEQPRVLADSFDGKKLNSPNDVALDAHGGLYFTDPRYGQGEPVEQPVMGVYYIAIDGKITRVVDDLERPNGVLVSPKGDWLYIAEPNKAELYRYAIEKPGILGEGTRIYQGDPDLDGSGPDGMAHDEHGNVYCTYKGITIVDPAGELIGRLPVPEHPANCAFGGKDGKTLFITARTGLYSVPLKVRGMARQPSWDVLGTLPLIVPRGWQPLPRSSRMRVGQYAIPAPASVSDGAGELIVYYFGSSGAGSAAANVERWIGQFEAEGRSARVLRGTSREGKYTLADITGTYNKAIGPPIRRQTKAMPGYRVINVHIEREGGDYFLKLEGPKATVDAAEGALRASFGADLSSEKAIEATAR